MSKPWGGIGAWAAEAEQAEAEERELHSAAAANSQVSGAGDSQNFPSLKEATATKPKKKKAMTLSEFTVGTYVGPGGAKQQRDVLMEPKGLTPEEMLRLQTGPKERSPEEIEHGRFNRGFQSYGGTGPPPARDGSWGGGRRSYGGIDDDRRAPPSRVSDFDQPSRADEVDNWAMAKKSLPLVDSGRNDRYGSIGSRADDVDNWAIGKKSLPVRSGSFGSGFRDSAQDSDRWGKGGPREEDRPRPRLVLDRVRRDGAPTEPAKTTRPSPFGAARPREDVLAEKGLDWKMQDQDTDSRKYAGSQSSRPSSAQSSRSDSAVPQVLTGAPVARPKVNPFGDAKPREVLLQEQGKDWRKMDFELEHRAVDRPETVEEKNLKEEIQHIKEEIEKEATVNANEKSLDGSDGQQPNLHELLLGRERDLELLIRELDDKVRFGQRLTDRPGSGAGRTIGFPESPSSHSGVSEDPRNRDFMDRPRSRGAGDRDFMDRPRSRGAGDAWTRPRSSGAGDAWSNPIDDRRTQGARERGFLGNREVDRSQSRERW